MKTKLFRVDQYECEGDRYDPDNWKKTLIAEFLNEDDAHQTAWLLAKYNVFDYYCQTGARKLGAGALWENRHKSLRTNTCPTCRSEYTRAEMIHREKWGTYRCECGTMFAINWNFDGNPCQIVDTPTADYDPNA